MTESAIPRRPHLINPALESVHLVLVYKNFAAVQGISHIGLGVTALNTLRVLRRHGVHCQAWAVQTPAELEAKLAKAMQGERPVTHVVISAMWVPPNDLGALAQRWPEVEFVSLNHSATSALNMDSVGITNIRATLDLELIVHNVRMAGNNDRFTQWIRGAFGAPGLTLPNLYDTTTFVEPVVGRRDHDPIRLASFGATRLLKNHLTAAEAALELARRLGVALEYYVNSGRPDGGEGVIRARRQLFEGLPHTKLIELPWTIWPKFRRTVRAMDLMLSPTFDETFCVIVADGIAEGVPTVTTGAVEWTPPHWHCEPWDPSSVVSVGVGLLHDRVGAIHDARHRLRTFVANGVQRWIRYLTKQPEKE